MFTEVTATGASEKTSATSSALDRDMTVSAAAMMKRSKPVVSSSRALSTASAPSDHTGILGSDAAIPVERATRIRASTLVMHGGASFAFMGETARTLSHAIPHAQLRTLEGQTHEVDPAVLAPALIDFFAQA
jgi:hypothetical protein